MTLRNVVKTLMVAMTASILGACSESYPGSEEYDHGQGRPPIQNVEGLENEPVMLYVHDQNGFMISTTRGLGPIDGTDSLYNKRLKQAVFYVFAFRDGWQGVSTGTNVSEILTQKPDLRYYVNADNAPSAYIDTVTNYNCLLDGYDYKLGLPTMLEGGQLLPRDKNEKLDTTLMFYYSYVNQETPYSFFAFHIDGLEPTNDVTEIRQKDKLVYKFQIDGSQDVIFGKSVDLHKLITQKEDGKGGTKYEYIGSESDKSKFPSDIWKSLSDQEKSKIYNIGGYSTFAAHRGIHPVIDLEHALTRLKFKAYAGGKDADGVTVTKIMVRSMHDATLTYEVGEPGEGGKPDGVNIAFAPLPPYNIDEERKDGFKHFLTMQEVKEVGGKITAQPFEEKKVEYKPVANWYDGTPTDLGSSLLVAPDSEYVLYMEFTDPKLNGGKSGWAQTNIKMADGTKFENGTEYIIKVAVYGIQEIEAKAFLPEWKKGGEVLIDPDDTDYE